MPVSCFDVLKPNTFSLPEKLLRHSAKLKPLRGPHERKTKKGVKSELRNKFLSSLGRSVVPSHNIATFGNFHHFRTSPTKVNFVNNF